MPILIMCGIPGSGKTTRSLEIKQYLEQFHKTNVIIINEENLQLKKSEAYANVQQEKITRSFLKSNVEKNISQQNVVIVDSLNYIKGYRYEMFCLARATKTQHCIIFCNSSYELSKKYNEQSTNGFPQDLFDDLVKRMEIPNQKNRWDSPLFELRDNEKTPLEDITEVLIFEEKKSKDPIATAPEVKYESNFLFELDKRVQNVIDELIQKQQEACYQGAAITFKDCKQKLTLTRNFNIIELKKHKQEFSNMIKLSPPKNIDQIGDAFIQYMNSIMGRI